MQRKRAAENGAARWMDNGELESTSNRFLPPLARPTDGPLIPPCAARPIRPGCLPPAFFEIGGPRASSEPANGGSRSRELGLGLARKKVGPCLSTQM